jgi:DNA helicase HerA-like ATPase
VKVLDKFANKENTVFVRIFYKGKFINYFFNPDDVENLGLGNIFDSIDPDPDFVQAQKEFENFGAEREKLLAERAKKKAAKLATTM